MKTILNIWGGKHVDVFIANMNVVQDAWIYEYYHWRISKQLDECNSFEGDKSLSLIIELPIKSYLCLPNVFFSEHQQTRIIIFSTLWLYYQIHWILFIVLTWPYETCIFIHNRNDILRLDATHNEICISIPLVLWSYWIELYEENIISFKR